MSKIELKLTDVSSHDLIVNLMQFYNYDLSAWLPLPFGEDGFFKIRPKYDYLSRTTTAPFLIFVDGQIAGFVIVDDEVTVPDARHNIGYMFVARQFRRRGVATHVMLDLLPRFKGRWQIWHIAENREAATFWRKLVTTMSGDKFDVHSLRIDNCNATLYSFG